ncbi:AIG1-like protein [Tanacetum coccineum]
MDENTVRLWLKDHQDAADKLARQQAEAFQLQLDTLCAEFVESVKNRFGPSKYKDLQGALSKLLQLGTVEDYQREFEKLMNRARLDDQAAPVAGTSAGLEANKVINDGDGELETKVLVDGKQDEAKVVGVVDEQNSDESNVLECNGVIGVGRLNDKHIKKKKMEAAIQRRL